MAAEWFYAENGQQRGPVTFEELQRRAAADLLRPSDLVWGPGLSDWAPASTQQGIFGGGQAPIAIPPPDRDFEDDRFYEPRRTSRPSNPSLKILLFVIGGMAIFASLCCGVLLLIGRNASSNEQKRDRAWNVNSGGFLRWSYDFKKGETVVITVSSAVDSDMDLFVFAEDDKLDAFMRANVIDNVLELCLAHDNRLDKDCRVEFVAPATQEYRVLLINRKSEQMDRNIPNNGRLFVTVDGK